VVFAEHLPPQGQGFLVQRQRLSMLAQSAQVGGEAAG